MASRILLTIVILAFHSSRVEAGIILGTAGDFAVLAGATVTNTGPTSIDGGNVGVTPGSVLSGLTQSNIESPYTIHSNDALAIAGQASLLAAYNAAAALTPSANLTGQDLGGMTLTPGVYFFASSAQLTGTLTLNDLGDPNAQFVFQIGSTLNTATGSSVVTINAGSPAGSEVFWQVGSSATIGTGSAVEGHLLALASITMMTGATLLNGSALAMNGSVTLDSNQINNPLVSVPEPSTLSMMLVGGSLLLLSGFSKAARARLASRPL
jgi:type VI secretion system secreted protein VgrG